MKNDFDQKIIQLVSAKNKLGTLKYISQFNSCLTNRVYDLDNKFVIKLGGIFGGTDLFAHQYDLAEVMKKSGIKVPDFLDYGDIDGVKYLLMTKMPGRSLASEWETLNTGKQENYLEQIAQELKKFHSIKCDNYATAICQKKYSDNFMHTVCSTIDFDQIGTKGLDNDILSISKDLQTFFETKQNILNESGTAALVFNDVWLDNFLVRKGRITAVIDLDWLCQAAPDYELAKIIYFFFVPEYFIDFSALKTLQGPMSREIAILKKNHSELFSHPDLLDRFRIYFLRSMIYLFKKYNNDHSQEHLRRIRHLYNSFYRTDSLDNFIYG